MMHWGRRWVVAGLVLSAWLVCCGCSDGPLDYPRKASKSLENPEQTHLGEQLQPQLAAHPGKSGFRLMVGGPDALKVLGHVGKRGGHLTIANGRVQAEVERGELV